MSSGGDMLEDFTSSSLGVMPYKNFLSDLSELRPALQALNSLSLGPESETDKSVAISRLSLLLTILRVPGPCQLLKGIAPLGEGAQFSVAEREVIGLPGPEANAPVFKNSMMTVAIKLPRILLRGQQKLDLSNPSVSRQMRNLILEITALCHPNLRDHRNIVKLLGWGTSTEYDQQVPFLALEVADYTLASYLCQKDLYSRAQRHHIALDIGSGLDALHEIGLIHGDLKPDNVLLFFELDYWVARLADFGGGADLGQGGSLEGAGTVGWRAPELRQHYYDGTNIDLSLIERIDNYSYGLLIWSILLNTDGLAPCAESVDAETVALSELNIKRSSFPILLHSALESSFHMLLKRDPRARAGKVGHLLNDRSRTYWDWTVLADASRERSFKNSALITSANGHDFPYGWQIPEISMQNAPSLASAFSRKKYMTTETIYSLFMKFAGSSLLIDREDLQERDLLLNLLHTGAERGSRPLRALIYIVHEYFQRQLSNDLYQLKPLWMSEAVASGAFFLRKTLKQLDSNLLEKGIRTFQENGGYNQYYAAFDSKVISDVLLETSDDDSVRLGEKLPLYPRGDQALHILSSATFSEDLVNMVKLIDHRQVNILNDYGETALYLACMAGETASVLLLLSHGADPSIIPSPGGPTCLHWLFHFSRDIDVVARELVKHGAPIHAQSERVIPTLHYPFTLPMGTPLHWAVGNSAVSATSALLCEGADPSIRDGCDPYAYNETVRTLDMLLPPDAIAYSVADHPTLGFSAIDVAVKNRDYDILSILLTNTNFDPNDTDEEGYSAIHNLDSGELLYTIYGNALWRQLFQGSMPSQVTSLRNTIAILLQHGFKLDSLTNRRNPPKSSLSFDQTALMIAVAQGQTETVEQLIDAGADVNVSNSKGATALSLFKASRYNRNRKRQSQVVSLLLGANANLHVHDRRNFTPFLHATYSHLLELATALLDHGANVKDRLMNKRDWHFGRTALAIAADSDPTRVAEVDEWLVTQLHKHILPLVADSEDTALHSELLERADLDGGTLLHYAAGNGLIRSCVVLIEAKVSINKIRRVIRKEETFYRTALDEVRTRLDEMNRPIRESVEGDDGIPKPDSEQERSEYKKKLRDIDKLLRHAGCVESRYLIEKQFDIPPEQDSSNQEKPLRLIKKGA